jgi:hypothetical protein
MDESYLKRAVCEKVKKLLPGAVIFRHEDKFTGGIPDISITWAGRTCWVEVKYDRPKSRAMVTGQQKLTLKRLRRHGRALLLTYTEDKNHDKFTSIQDGGEALIGMAPKFDHQWAAEKIKEELERSFREWGVE